MLEYGVKVPDEPSLLVLSALVDYGWYGVSHFCSELGALLGGARRSISRILGKTPKAPRRVWNRCFPGVTGRDLDPGAPTPVSHAPPASTLRAWRNPQPRAASFHLLRAARMLQNRRFKASPQEIALKQQS